MDDDDVKMDEWKKNLLDPMGTSPAPSPNPKIPLLPLFHKKKTDAIV